MSLLVWTITIIVASWFVFLILAIAIDIYQDRKELRAGMLARSAGARQRTEKCTTAWHKHVHTAVPLSDQVSASWRYKQERALRAALMTEGLLSADASSISRKLAQELWASLGPARRW